MSSLSPPLSSSRLPLLLAPEVLAAQQALLADTLRVVDITKPGVYAQLHVPGAIHLDYRRLQSGDPALPGLLPAPGVLQQLFEDIGITPATHVVAYDDEGGTRAARLLWLLHSAGHQRMSYLDGGIHAWLAAELPVETDPVVALPGRYPAGAMQLAPVLDITQVLALHTQPGVVVWDARSAEEYRGERVSAKRAGHIPGAVNYEWSRALLDDGSYRLRPLEEIRVALAALGIVPSQQVITHCQTHHRSSFTWLLGQLLGLSVQGYPGSWSEWGNREDTPIVQGAG